MEGVSQTLCFLFSTFFTNTVWINNTVFVMFVNSNNGSGWDTSIDVGGSIEWVEYSDILFTFVDDDCVWC